MEENKQHPFFGGVVEESKATKFISQNAAGQPEEVDLPDRITVTYGKKKATLNGRMVEALVETWKDDGFREWASRCR